MISHDNICYLNAIAHNANGKGSLINCYKRVVFLLVALIWPVLIFYRMSHMPQARNSIEVTSGVCVCVCVIKGKW